MRKRPALSAYVYPGAILVRPESEMLINLEWGMSNRENPAIGIEQERRNDSVRTMVRIAVPTIPDFECDVWCYEDKLGQGDDYPQADGSMILKHTHPEGAEVETTLVPSKGAIDWTVTVSGPPPEAVNAVCSVQGCWQFRRAPGFQSLKGHFVE